MKLNKTGYLIKEGFKSIFTHGFMSFASVTIIIACLVIMGSFTLLSVNIDEMIVKLEQENEVVCFVDENLSEEDARAIQPAIEAIGNISDIQFVTREQAMEDFSQDYDPGLFEDVDADVFRHRYILNLNDITMMAQTEAALKSVDGIAKVRAHLDIANAFISLRNVVSIVSLIIVTILAIVSVFIMANTIKLATFGRREEIAIMKMVGATNAFIRLPFIIEGLILGLVGAIAAFFIEWGVYGLVSEKVMGGIVGALVECIPFTALMFPVLGVFLCVGVVVGTFGSVIAIRNYLKV
ncbi:MAG: permease-like cell division protein FtsX [Candidatus Heteroscillospira sp.]